MSVIFRSVNGLSWAMFLRSFPGGLCALLVCMSLGGCGSSASDKETGTVSGTVVSDGKPVTEGLVSFSIAAKGVGALADLDANGAFKFESPLPVGEYVVTISPPRPDPNLGPKEMTPIDPKDYPNIPKKYHSDKTSGLTAKVVTGENKIELNMEQ